MSATIWIVLKYSNESINCNMILFLASSGFLVQNLQVKCARFEWNRTIIKKKKNLYALVVTKTEAEDYSNFSFFLNCHMPRLKQTRGSKVNFLSRLKQTWDRKYINFFLNFWYSLGLGYEKIEAVNIKYASSCNRGIKYYLLPRSYMPQLRTQSQKLEITVVISLPCTSV